MGLWPTVGRVGAMLATLRFSVIVLLWVAFFLTGCTDYAQLRDPIVSDLTLDDQSMPEVNRVIVPMPQTTAATPPTRAEAAGLWGKQTRSFFRDRRATAVGDLVTVIIEINDQAQLRNATERSRDGDQNASSPIILGQNPIASGGDLIDLNSESSSKGEGSIRRNEKISLRVSATIMQKLPNGNFVLAGRQEVKVNYELRELRIAGIVRPMDIDLDNTIAYDKIAEARISYGGRGQISAMQRARYGEDVLEVILPY